MKPAPPFPGHENSPQTDPRDLAPVSTCMSLGHVAS